MRYEKKYRIEDARYEEVLYQLHILPAGFKESYPDRWVNSIYFDDVLFSAFQDNLAGISRRLKHRIRWYGDLEQATKPRLEKKIKINALGTKEYYPIADFSLQSPFDAEALLYQNYPATRTLYPVVLIRYLRSYLESYDHKFRATIDRRVQYYLFQGNLFFKHSPALDTALVLEIKFEKEYLEEADYFLQEIPFRHTKNSKYVNAVLSNY